jgi:acyl carrier protein
MEMDMDLREPRQPPPAQTASARIRRVLADLGHLTRSLDGISDDDDLYDAGLRSLTAVHVMLGLEEEFGIEFPESMLHRGVLSTVRQIQAAVAALAGGVAPPPLPLPLPSPPLPSPPSSPSLSRE